MNPRSRMSARPRYASGFPALRAQGSTSETKPFTLRVQCDEGTIGIGPASAVSINTRMRGFNSSISLQAHARREGADQFRRECRMTDAPDQRGELHCTKTVQEIHDYGGKRVRYAPEPRRSNEWSEDWNTGSSVPSPKLCLTRLISTHAYVHCGYLVWVPLLQSCPTVREENLFDKPIFLKMTVPSLPSVYPSLVPSTLPNCELKEIN